MSIDPLTAGLVFTQLGIALLKAADRLASGEPVTQAELAAWKEKRKAAVSDFEAAAANQLGEKNV